MTNLVLKSPALVCFLLHFAGSCAAGFDYTLCLLCGKSVVIKWLLPTKGWLLKWLRRASLASEFVAVSYCQNPFGCLSREGKRVEDGKQTEAHGTCCKEKVRDMLGLSFEKLNVFGGLSCSSHKFAAAGFSASIMLLVYSVELNYLAFDATL
ncbi:hypothetical protein U1Q18_009816 [Sarracenia purpurea var. burkii]